MTWTVSNWLLLIQTIVLAATGFIVYWYTKETQKIRKETSNQNLMLAEQLRIMKEKTIQEEKKERNLMEPVFIYNGGGSSVDNTTIKLINKGSVIRNIKTKNLSIGCTYSPKSILESDKEITFYFHSLRQDLPEQVEFLIEYEDKLGEIRTKEMLLIPKKRMIIEK